MVLTIINIIMVVVLYPLFLLHLVGEDDLCTARGIGRVISVTAALILWLLFGQGIVNTLAGA